MGGLQGSLSSLTAAQLGAAAMAAAVAPLAWPAKTSTRR